MKTKSKNRNSQKKEKKDRKNLNIHKQKFNNEDKNIVDATNITDYKNNDVNDDHENKNIVDESSYCNAATSLTQQMIVKEELSESEKLIYDNRKRKSKNQDSEKIKKKDTKNFHEHKFNNKNTQDTNIPDYENNDMNDNYKDKNMIDATNYCSDATYLAQKMIMDEELSASEKLKLYHLRVQLKCDALPQHEIETRAGSHMPTREQVNLFEQIAPLIKGTYLNKEDDIIVSNWKTFCKLHDWDVEKTKPFLQLRVGSKMYIRKATERRKFVQFLADGLPNRTLYSVYHRFRNLYEKNEQRRYRPEEDKLIINHLENNPGLDEKRKYSDLAKVLHRTRNSIWRRYKVLKKKNKLS